MAYEKLRELYEAGHTIDEIAEAWEVSPSFVYLRLKKSGTQMRKAVVRGSQSRYDEIVKLRAKGLTIKAIAEIIGLSYEGVRSHLKKIQVKKLLR